MVNMFNLHDLRAVAAPNLTTLPSRGLHVRIGDLSDPLKSKDNIVTHNFFLLQIKTITINFSFEAQTYNCTTYRSIIYTAHVFVVLF